MAPKACEPDNTNTQSDFRVMRVVEICVQPEEDGGFSAFVPSLPGVFGQGSGFVEALRDCERGLHAAIESYNEEGRNIPWKKDSELQDPNVTSAWVQVDVERVA